MRAFYSLLVTCLFFLLFPVLVYTSFWLTPNPVVTLLYYFALLQLCELIESNEFGGFHDFNAFNELNELDEFNLSSNPN